MPSAINLAWHCPLTLRQALLRWVLPPAQGGGSALAIGIDIKQPAAGGGPNALRLDAYVARAGSAVLDGPRSFSNSSVTGDPAFILWLPLGLLMPGSSLITRIWFALMLHLRGLVSSAAAFGRVLPHRAAYWALRRAFAEWGALPVDLHEVKECILAAY